MFADLEKFKSEEFYHEYSMIELKTLHGNEEYQVIAAFAVPVYTGTDLLIMIFLRLKMLWSMRNMSRNVEKDHIMTRVLQLSLERS